MKRLCLVLFVCLSVQLNAASAPFLHVHADDAHEADHPQGSVVHRHLTPHTAPDLPHHAAEIAQAIEGVDGQPSVEQSEAASPLAIGALTPRLSPVSTSIAPPATAAVSIARPQPALSPDDDTGHGFPDSPDPRSSSHRGPPR